MEIMSLWMGQDTILWQKVMTDEYHQSYDISLHNTKHSHIHRNYTHTGRSHLQSRLTHYTHTHIHIHNSDTSYNIKLGALALPNHYSILFAIRSEERFFLWTGNCK